MNNKTKKLMEEMAIQHNETLKYFENISFDQVYKNGFTAAHTLAEQEIAELKDENEKLKTQAKLAWDNFDKSANRVTETIRENISLTASLKSAVNALTQLRNESNMSWVERVAGITISKITTKHPDMFKDEL